MKKINMKDQLLSSINQTAFETIIVAYSRDRGRSIGKGELVLLGSYLDNIILDSISATPNANTYPFNQYFFLGCSSIGVSRCVQNSCDFSRLK